MTTRARAGGTGGVQPRGGDACSGADVNFLQHAGGRFPVVPGSAQMRSCSQVDRVNSAVNSPSGQSSIVSWASMWRPEDKGGFPALLGATASRLGGNMQPLPRVRHTGGGRVQDAMRRNTGICSKMATQIQDLLRMNHPAFDMVDK